MVEAKVNAIEVNQAVTAEKIARLQQDMEAMTKSIAELNKTLTDISLLLSASKGSVRMLLMIGSAGAALGSAVAEIIHLWR